MAKRPRKAREPFEPDVARRLREIGPYTVVTAPGSCEIYWGPVAALASDLTAFHLEWVLGAPGSAVPSPDEPLFDLWERYRRSHATCCVEYRQRLVALFAQSQEAAYEGWMWKALKRKRPTQRDLSGVVSQGTVRLYRWQTKKQTDYELLVSFVVFWDAHGVEMRLGEAGDGFEVVAWAVGTV
jgi:hypothetical protein